MCARRSFHRQRTGEGQYLTTSLLAAALTLQSPWLASVPPSDAFLVQPLLDRFAELRDAGASYAELIEARREAPRQTRAFRLYYGGYPVRDGAIILGALTPANRNQIRRALGITDDPTESDDFNALAPESGPIVDRVRAQIAERMLSATMEEWMQRFDAEGAPASMVRLPEEINLDPTSTRWVCCARSSMRSPAPSATSARWSTCRPRRRARIARRRRWTPTRTKCCASTTSPRKKSPPSELRAPSASEGEA